MCLVRERFEARQAQDDAEERRLDKCVKNAARRDRKAWLSNLASTGRWGTLRQLQQWTVHSQGRLTRLRNCQFGGKGGDICFIIAVRPMARTTSKPCGSAELV